MKTSKIFIRRSSQWSTDASALLINKPDEVEVEHKTITSYYLIMFLFGIAALIPTSTLLTSLDYFIVRYPDYQPGFLIPLALNAPLFIFMIPSNKNMESS